MLLLIGHWVAEGQVTGGCCQLQNANASNVFSCIGVDKGRIPVELVATIIEKFSFEGQWVLNLTNAIGGGISAGIAAKRNVVCLADNESAATITVAAAAGAKEDKHEIEKDYSEEQMQ
ncbi:uncharacterized protein LOC110047340 [Orbicella faveolata]|uniref:uncharacterized protein LOC110047340 n=1 Tax=Orbicella faveolata TaxID=48498 RepID=UPI0009E1FC00|nr:uncharacterized protein LOC110047340 [Orbicella faveolata]